MHHKQAQIIKLNPIDDDSAGEIHHVFQVSYRKEANLIGTDNFPPLKRSIEDIQEASTSFYGIVKNTILAAAMELEVSGSHLHICSLVVHPDFFRQGLGNQLVRFALESFKPKTASVETASVNAPAIRLYEKAGFREKDKYITSVGIEKIRLIRDS